MKPVATRAGIAAHPQQQRHRARVLLAVARLRLEQEALERARRGRRRLGVGEAAAEVGLDRLDVVERVVGAALAARCESAHVRRRSESRERLVAVDAVERRRGRARARTAPRDGAPRPTPGSRPRARRLTRRRRARVGRGRQLDRAEAAEGRGRSRSRRPRSSRSVGFGRVDGDRVGVAAAQRAARRPRCRAGRWGSRRGWASSGASVAMPAVTNVRVRRLRTRDLDAAGSSGRATAGSAGSS